MAESRRDHVYVPPRDTGLPASLPTTPGQPGETIGDRSSGRAVGVTADGRHGGFLGDTPGGLSSGAYGGSAGGPSGGLSGGAYGGSYGGLTGGLDGDMSTVGADMSQTSDKLQREIKRVRRQIKSLSATRSHKVRMDIRKAMSECSSSDSASENAYKAPETTSTHPTRSSDGGGRKGRVENRDPSPVVINQPEQPARQRCVRSEATPSRKDRSASASGPAGEAVHKEVRGETSIMDPTSQVSSSVGNASGDAVIDGGLASGTVIRERATRKPLKLEKYDGLATPLETFLAKYQNCVRFNGWSAEECAVFLRDSLNGNASQILWEISDDASAEEIIRLLRNRFGNSNQMERYRAELHGRRRKHGESVQMVYQDIRRLMALGFPGQSGEVFDILGRDSFLAALNDPALRIRVLDQQPKTLDEALSSVIRMEAYSSDNVVGDDNSERKRVRVVSPARETDADRRIRKLEGHVEKQKREIQQLREAVPRNVSHSQNRGGGIASGGLLSCPASGAQGGLYGGSFGGPQIAMGNSAAPDASAQAGWHSPGQYLVDTPQYTTAPSGVQWSQPPPTGRYQATASRTFRGRGGGRRQIGNRLPRDVCARCLGHGHWQAHCPITGFRPTPSGSYGGPGYQSSGPQYDAPYGGPDNTRMAVPICKAHLPRPMCMR